MNQEICNNCNKLKYIVNRKNMQCQDCNHFRLHNETIQETQNRKSKQYQEKAKLKVPKVQTTPKKIYKLKQSTSKQSLLNQKLSEVKNEIEMEAIQNDMYFCQGCGKGGGLDKSHILSIRQRKDLELIKENIDLLCRDCHMDWESSDILKILKLDCLERYFEYIEREDSETLMKLVVKLDEFLMLASKDFDETYYETIEKAIFLSKKFN